MAYYSTIINGSQKVWMARVAYRGQRKSRVCNTKQEAKEAEAELLGELKAKAGQLEAAGAQPATMGALLDAYVLDLEAPFVTRPRSMTASHEHRTGGMRADSAPHRHGCQGGLTLCGLTVRSDA